MKRIISYMVKYYDGSFDIKMDTFEKKITETNIQLFLADKEDEEKQIFQKAYTEAPSYYVKTIKCHFLSVTTLEA